MEIGKVLKQLRTKHEMSQEELSLRLNVTRPYIHMLEDGERKPSPDLMDKMASIFKVPKEFMYWSCLEEKDIPERKREAFKLLKPAIDDFVKSLMDEPDEE